MSLGSPGSVYKRKNGYVLGVRLVVGQLAQTSQGSSGPGPVMPVPKRRLSTATRDSNLETSSPFNPVASHPLAPFFPHLPAHAPSRSKTFLVHQSEAFIASSLQPFVFRFHFLLPTLFNCRLLPPLSAARILLRLICRLHRSFALRILRGCQKTTIPFTIPILKTRFLSHLRASRFGHRRPRT